MRDPYITDGTTKEFAGAAAPPGRRGLRLPGDPWVVIALIASGTALIVAATGLVVAARSGRGDAPGPLAAAPSVSPRESAAVAPPARPADSPRATASPGRAVPTETRLAWRSEELSDGSVRMVVGDIDAAPRDPAWIGGSDYRTERDKQSKIIKVRGWWCATKVPATLSYSAGRLRGQGFSTQCSGRPGRMRQRYGFERSSWSGFRPYTGARWTAWTAAQGQTVGPLSVPCPAGRTGTYDYRLSVVLEIAGKRVGNAYAHSDDGYRGDCGTGVS
ncbi:MAG TPA: hypothetical protein VFU43_22630 [Streptosporangiaceae bacterium]|nr:hypothetical protein [Streptosporangiaceae bacterium]